jgi:CheY-like chemotaxis protein
MEVHSDLAKVEMHVQGGAFLQSLGPKGSYSKAVKAELLLTKGECPLAWNAGGNMLRVLIVEDNPFFREAFRTVLQERISSVVIEEAGNGEEALQKITGVLPDFVFADMRLTGMNGLELAQKIKRDFPRIRIAMLTGYDFPEYRRLASQSGVDRYFVKDSLDWKDIEEFVQYIPKENR